MHFASSIRVAIIQGIFVLVAMAQTSKMGGGSNGIKTQEFSTPTLQPDGSQTYRFRFETEDGIRREERGKADDENGVSVIGTYSYTAPDDTLVQVYYTAGTKGFVILSKAEYLKFSGVQRIPAPALASLAG